MNSKISAALVGGSVLAGGVIGAALGAPSLAGAQDVEEPPAVEVPDEIVPEADGGAGPEAGERPDGDRAEGERGPRGRRGAKLGVAADLLDMTEDELRAEVEAGAEVRDLLEEAGISRDEVREARQVALEERLAEAVANGEITQEEADERLERCNRDGGPGAEDQEVTQA